MRKSGCFAAAILALVSLAATAGEVGLVTAVSGKVKWQEMKAVASELKPFVKVREGDRLMLEEASRLQVVYFEGGRQETWLGAGALEVGNGSSRTLKGSLQPEVRTLPLILVKQLSKTPSLDSNVKSGMIRMRSIPSHDRLEAAEMNYAELRKQAEPGDRNPELYLLASYYELDEFDKLEAMLGQMNDKAPKDPELAALTALYSAAISNARAPEKR
jgi:hypothetical protein